MEKKEYMAPEMEVIALKMQGMLAASTMDETGGNDPNEPQPGPF